MLIPIRTDYRRRSRPWMNYLLIAANVAIFLAGYNGLSPVSNARIDRWMLNAEAPDLPQFFTCVFLHANWAHLLGNMVFLWVFGNAINDKFGHAGYLAFYLAGGVVACIGYILLGGGVLVLGASGAICAVTGAYLVLLPHTRITLLLLLVFVFIPVEISSLIFIAIQFAINAFMTLEGMTGSGGGGVAYAAHVAGYVFGIAVSAGLLAIRAMPRDSYDLLGLLSAWKRRAGYLRAVQQGYDPFQQAAAVRRGPAAPPPAAPEAPTPAGGPPDLLNELRGGVVTAHARHDFDQAAVLYLQLVQHFPEAALPRQVQLDMANQMMSAEQYPAAAEAYERFLRQNPSYENGGDILLMLGLLNGRYLHRYEQAEDYLTRALRNLHDANKTHLAETALEEVRRRGGLG